MKTYCLSLAMKDAIFYKVRMRRAISRLSLLLVAGSAAVAVRSILIIFNLTAPKTMRVEYWRGTTLIEHFHTLPPKLQADVMIFIGILMLCALLAAVISHNMRRLMTSFWAVSIRNRLVRRTRAWLAGIKYGRKDDS